MNQPTVAEPEAPDRSRRTAGIVLAVVAAGLAASLVMALVAGMSSGTPTVPRVVFENPTDYALDVEVRSEGSTGWTSAGSVAQRSTAVVEEVVDQGDVWVFRFDSQGRTGGEVRMTRSELEGSGWRIAVPPEVGRRLADSGAPPSP